MYHYVVTGILCVLSFLWGYCLRRWLDERFRLATDVGPTEIWKVVAEGKIVVDEAWEHRMRFCMLDPETNERIAAGQVAQGPADMLVQFDKVYEYWETEDGSERRLMLKEGRGA